MGLVHCGSCAMGLLINQKFVFGWQIGILRHKKILDWEDFTIDMETWFLFTANKMHFSIILGQDLHKGPKRAFLTR